MRMFLSRVQKARSSATHSRVRSMHYNLMEISVRTLRSYSIMNHSLFEPPDNVVDRVVMPNIEDYVVVFFHDVGQQSAV